MKTLFNLISYSGIVQRQKYDFCHYQQKATDILLVWADFSLV